MKHEKKDAYYSGVIRNWENSFRPLAFGKKIKELKMYKEGVLSPLFLLQGSLGQNEEPSLNDEDFFLLRGQVELAQKSKSTLDLRPQDYLSKVYKFG